MTRWTPEQFERVTASVQQAIKAGVNTIVSGPPVTFRRAPKYRNQITETDGHRFDSRLEAKRYRELKLLLAAGNIEKLRIHSKWYLHVNGQKIGYYESDFDYLENGQQVVEDCKGMRTALYQWKKKHLACEYGLHIREITA
jgi:Protein of unknown function (DUF1064)